MLPEPVPSFPFAGEPLLLGGAVRPGRGFRIIEALSHSLDGRFERKFGPSGSMSTLIFPYVDQCLPIDLKREPFPIISRLSSCTK